MIRIRWARVAAVVLGWSSALLASALFEERSRRCRALELEAAGSGQVGPSDVATTLEIRPVEDLVRVPDFGSLCRFELPASESREVNEGLALEPWQAEAVLRAMTAAKPGELEVHRGQLIVLCDADGHARVQAAVDALRRSIDPGSAEATRDPAGARARGSSE